jgi:signal transduction histidine kinase
LSPLSPTSVVAVVRDITDRVNAGQELERQVAERTRELRLLLDVSRNVASTLDMRELAGTLLSQLWTVVGFDGAALMLLQDGGARVFESPIGNEDAPGTVVDRMTTAPPGGTGWMAIERREPVAVEDSRDDPALAAWVAQIPGRATAGRSWLSAPLIAQGRVLGVLNFWSVTPGTFGEQHAELALAVANQTAVAIENARLYQEASAMAAIEERQRLARELHDSVSQALYGIALGARTARTLLDTDAARATEPVDYVLQLAEVGLAEMRALIFELRPESLEMEGLVAALEKQIAATRARYGLEVVTDLGQEPSLTLPQKEVFYRIAQEALHNVVKHAHASRVDIILSSDNGNASLMVRDNGVGFEAGQAFPGHMGLVSFSERAASIGAKIEVESAVGSGTAVKLSLG